MTKSRFVAEENDFTITPPKPKQKAFDESDVSRDDDKATTMTDKSKTKQGTQEAKPDDKGGTDEQK